MSPEETFRYFDKHRKNYLTKHELRCALIYLIGIKLDYDVLQELWEGKDAFYKEKKMASPGVNLPYFQKIIQKNDIHPPEEKLIELEYSSLDIQGKGNIDYFQFSNLLKSVNINYLNEKTKRDIFDKLDFDGDGYISLKDYRYFMM